VLGIAAYSGTGKTTLLRKVLPSLRAHGLRVAMIKHAHHSFDTDVPGKDSYELRKAGATQMLVASRHRWALVTETGDAAEPRLEELLAHLDHRKIELHRPSLGNPLLCSLDRSIIAVAVDAPLAHDPGIPVLDLNQPEQIIDFILRVVMRKGSQGVRGVASRAKSRAPP